MFREIPLIVLEFFPVLLFLGFLGEGFFGKSSRAGVGWGGLSGVFCVLFKGKCCAFFCSAFFRRLKLCFSKVRPEDIFSDIVWENFRVRTCTGNVLSGVVGDFYMEKSTLLLEKPRGRKFSFC